MKDKGKIVSPSESVVAFQGEMGAFSEMAARSYFHETVNVVPKSSFSKLFESVESAECTHGMVPVENSLAGSVHENYDLLLKHDLQIVGEIKLRIVHTLIVNPGTRLEQIRRVTSHPQALAQCSEFIRTLDGAETVVDYDTAGAAKRLKETGDADAAAIASAQAAIDYGLEILQVGIENNHQNYTRFLVVAREGVQPEEPEEPSKTSIVFALKSVPGALFKSLSVFALRDIDLLKIESRPLNGRPWEYAFYLDFKGHCGLEPCARAIDHLKEIATFLKILGSYRQGETVEGKARGKRELP